MPEISRRELAETLAGLTVVVVNVQHDTSTGERRGELSAASADRIAGDVLRELGKRRAVFGETIGDPAPAAPGMSDELALMVYLETAFDRLIVTDPAAVHRIRAWANDRYEN